MKTRKDVVDIQHRVADRYGVRVTDLRSARRNRHIVIPRHVAIYLCRRLTTHSLPALGRQFGDRDHASIAYACRKVEELLERDPAEARPILELEREIESAQAEGPLDGSGRDRDSHLHELAKLLERRKALRGAIERAEGQIEDLDLQIDGIGRRLWGADEGVADNETECGQ